MSFSKTQLDRLGNRLRLLEPIQDEDRLVYAEYRASYQPALARVSELVRRISRLPPSARLKTLESTIQKLRRQTIRLSQVDDIAGCRIVVGDLLSQDRVVSALVSASAGARIVDRRARPQHGYRAVHVVCRDESGQDVEVQVRTRAQDMWGKRLGSGCN